MRILVNHDGQQLGPFDETEIARALSQGVVRMEDLAWHEGLTTWVPLKEALNSAYMHTDARPGNGPTSGMAITSLVLGLSTLFFCLLTGIPAIIFGHIARGEIRRSRGQVSGDGIALAGLVLGYTSVAFVAAGIAILMIFAGATGVGTKAFLEQAIQESAARPEQAINASREVSRALRTYSTDHGGSFPETLDELVPDYLPDNSKLRCPFNPEEEVGYLYYGGKASDPADEPLLMTKGTDEHGRHVVIKKGGKVTLKKERTRRNGSTYNYEIEVSQ
jgi:hypothetical protein